MGTKETLLNFSLIMWDWDSVEKRSDEDNRSDRLTRREERHTTELIKIMDEKKT